MLFSQAGECFLSIIMPGSVESKSRRRHHPCWSIKGFSIFVLISLSFQSVRCNPNQSNNNNNDTVNLSPHPVIIVVSFDGFRFDFFKRTETPNLDYLKGRGVSVPYMRNQFITKTFPNHHSVSTGLYLESHGVVDNEVFDPLYNKTLKVDSELFWNWNNDTVPLWTLNELAGDGRRSGVMMWPGSDHPYGPKRSIPSKMVVWNDTVPFNWRIDRVIQWITDESEPANLVFMYFEEPDEYCHAFGPESDEVIDKIRKLDNATGYLIEQLKSKGIFDKVNLIFLSDHGFEEVKVQNMINITALLDKHLYQMMHGSTPVLQLVPTPGKFEEVYGILESASRTMNFSVYSKKQLATVPNWHYSNNRRILDILVLADLGFVFDNFTSDIEYFNKQFNRTANADNAYGVHGYDNRILRMHPFFLAHGPMFKKKFIGDPFENVDLFPLICRLLDIEEPANNGSYAHVKGLLLQQGFAVGSPVGWAIGAGLLFGTMILFGIMSILATAGRTGKSRLVYASKDEAGYRFINRRGSCDSTEDDSAVDEFSRLTKVNEEDNVDLDNCRQNLGTDKEESAALLLSAEA